MAVPRWVCRVFGVEDSMPTPESAEVREYADQQARDPWEMKVRVVTQPAGVVVRGLSLLAIIVILLAVLTAKLWSVENELATIRLRLSEAAERK